MKGRIIDEEDSRVMPRGKGVRFCYRPWIYSHHFIFLSPPKLGPGVEAKPGPDTKGKHTRFP